MNKHLMPDADSGRNTAAISTITSSAIHSRSFMLIAVALGLLLTLTSIGIAVMSALQRAVGLPEQVACVALAVAAVFGVHLLPALSRGRSVIVRCCAAMLYVASLLVAFYGQASFFLTAQRNAGNRRADTVFVPLANPKGDAAPTRDALTIASDEEKVRTALAINDSSFCSNNCRARKRRHDLLEARLGMLTTEKEEARRRQVLDDRQATLEERQRDSMRNDPATVRLARATGADEQTLDLLLALVSAGVLDFTGSFCWYLAFERSRDRVVTGPALAVVHSDWNSLEHMGSVDGVISDFNPPAADDADSRLTQLVHDVAAGSVRPTVDGIREHFNCAQKTAIQLRRDYCALHKTAQSALSSS